MQHNFDLYTGPEKSYRTLSQIQHPYSNIYCMIQCTENGHCDGVKVNQVTGTRNIECLLLGYVYGCVVGDIYATDVYVKQRGV